MHGTVGGPINLNKYAWSINRQDSKVSRSPFLQFLHAAPPTVEEEPKDLVQCENKLAHAE